MRKTWPLLALLPLAALSVFTTLAMLRGSLTQASGDEGTYLAMTASLALDGDLSFGVADRARLEALADRGRRTVILQESGGGVTFSKPILYAVVAAPFYRLLGEDGLVAANTLLLLAALALAWLALARLGPAPLATATLLTFACVSVVPAYIAWRTSDSLQVALALAGLALGLGAARPASAGASALGRRLLERRGAVELGGLCLGLAAYVRPPNALLGLAAIVGLLLAAHPRRALRLTAGAVAGFVLLTLLGVATTGAAVSYKQVRASFDATTGYPAGAGAEPVMGQFEAAIATHSLALRPRLEPLVSAYSGLYFLVGRHTGLLVYFPAALLLAGVALRRPDRLGLCLLLGAAAVALFYVVWLPRNYFGGEGFVGNRYFLAAYPLLLSALPRLPDRRLLAVAWLWGVVVAASALSSSATTAQREPSSQNHAYRGIFRLLPYESTAPAIDGRRDRYWSDEFLRFVDPYAEVGDWAFRLETGQPAAELEVASRRPHGLMRFVVHADAPRIEVVYEDWRSRQVFPLSSQVGGVNGLVEIHPSPPWRRHPFWFGLAEGMTARLLRLSVRTPDGRPALAELRYLGPYRLPQRIFERDVVALDLPPGGVAGEVARVPVRVRNRGRRDWTSDRVLGVYLAYRFWPEGGGPPIEGRRLPLPAPVEPGGLLDATLEVRWPSEPGRYTLVVDLVLEGVAWFADRNGAPLARAPVEVVAASEALPERLAEALAR